MIKPVIITGCIIVFISAFFIVFAYDSIFKIVIECIQSPVSQQCNSRSLGFLFIFGILAVFVLIILNGITFYIMIKSWRPPK